MKNKIQTVNPRLLSSVKRKRKTAVRLAAFQLCYDAIKAFDKETQLVALRAVAAIIGLTDDKGKQG
jgi:hypothetical protein